MSVENKSDQLRPRIITCANVNMCKFSQNKNGDYDDEINDLF